MTLANEQGKYYKRRLMRRYVQIPGCVGQSCWRRWLLGGTSAEMRNVCVVFALDGANEMLVRLYSRPDGWCHLYEYK